jgi:hypothetical protein
LDARRGIGGKALERRGVRRWGGGSHRWWHRIFTYSSVNSVLFSTHSILLMRSPFSAMTLSFSHALGRGELWISPFSQLDQLTIHHLASSPTTTVPLPLTSSYCRPPIAYLCGPAVCFVLCFILQPDGAFDCPRCPGWCLLSCDAAAAARHACAATCCCCAIYRCLLLLPLFVAAAVWREG